jgi:hypothetical protein
MAGWAKNNPIIGIRQAAARWTMQVSGVRRRSHAWMTTANSLKSTAVVAAHQQVESCLGVAPVDGPEDRHDHQQVAEPSAPHEKNSGALPKGSESDNPGDDLRGERAVPGEEQVAETALQRLERCDGHGRTMGIADDKGITKSGRQGQGVSRRSVRRSMEL